MQTTYNNVSRVGNITSSEIVALMANGKAKGSIGKPFYTYIEECNFERKLGRPIEKESNAKPLVWGKLIEKRVFGLLPTSYKLCSQETIPHPTIESWFGSPDGEKFDPGKTVMDIKAPLTMKSFCQLVSPYYELVDGIWKEIHPALTIEAVRANHKDGEKFYQQLVSNSILTDSKYAELIVYCPYKSELDEIRAEVINGDGENLSKLYWLVNAQDEELPFLHEGGHYKNINIIRFEVPEADKINLTTRVRMADKLLIEVKNET